MQLKRTLIYSSKPRKIRHSLNSETSKFNKSLTFSELSPVRARPWRAHKKAAAHYIVQPPFSNTSDQRGGPGIFYFPAFTSLSSIHLRSFESFAVFTVKVTSTGASELLITQAAFLGVCKNNSPPVFFSFILLLI